MRRSHVGRSKGEFIVPKLFVIDGYQISIWSNENGEPIHVHISKKKPSPNSTKLWLLSNGQFVQANPNDTRIKEADMRRIIKKLSPLAMIVKDQWIAYHGYEKYYE